MDWPQRQMRNMGMSLNIDPFSVALFPLPDFCWSVLSCREYQPQMESFFHSYCTSHIVIKKRIPSKVLFHFLIWFQNWDIFLTLQFLACCCCDNIQSLFEQKNWNCQNLGYLCCPDLLSASYFVMGHQSHVSLHFLIDFLWHYNWVDISLIPYLAVASRTPLSVPQLSVLVCVL